MKSKVINHKNNKRAFTLIEMIGVLAVIAILAAVLIPKVFEAINNSRINNSSLTCGSVKTAIADHYAKFGGLNIDGSSGAGVAITAIPFDKYDQVLLKEQFMDKLFAVKIGDGTNGVSNTRVQLAALPATTGGAVAVGAAEASAATSSGFNLSGVGGTNECVGSYVVQGIITGVAEADAQALSQRIDGNELSTPLGTPDTAGRVKYASGSPTTVFVYLTHR